LERSESALGNIGQFGSPRPPSLSPHQTTGSYGVPSPAIGSDIVEYFPVAETASYRPSLLEVWMDTDPPEPPRTGTASVDSSRAGHATGVAQPGPTGSVSVEKRPSSLAYLLADIPTQQGVNRPGNVDMTQPGLVSTVVNPLYQSGP